jgi:hypothetical protein
MGEKYWYCVGMFFSEHVRLCAIFRLVYGAKILNKGPLVSSSQKYGPGYWIRVLGIQDTDLN